MDDEEQGFLRSENVQSEGRIARTCRILSHQPVKGAGSHEEQDANRLSIVEITRPDLGRGQRMMRSRFAIARENLGKAIGGPVSETRKVIDPDGALPQVFRLCLHLPRPSLLHSNGPPGVLGYAWRAISYCLLSPTTPWGPLLSRTEISLRN